MNQYYDYWKNSINTQLSRDPIFLDVLSKFNNQPINVLEIGCARSIDNQSRYGDGWSSLFWADYILQYGGSLLSCDIDTNSINNVKILLDQIPIKFDTVIEDGSTVLKSKNCYDLIYLDGSDCPNQMLDQIKLCDLKNSYVFCDDFNQKGIMVSKEYPNHILYRLSNNHQMALFYNSLNSFVTVNL